MLNTDYPIEALDWLLKEDCVLARYYPLIPYKTILIERLSEMGCRTKTDCMKQTDQALLAAGLENIAMVQLFKAFLTMYDIRPGKLKEIASFCCDEAVVPHLQELYHLPGVQKNRASLYYRAGYRSLADIAVATPEEIIEKTNHVIKNENLKVKAPFLKEAKTHIAVARAFTSNCC